MLLAAYRVGYERVARPLIFRRSAQQAHSDVVALLALADRWTWAAGLLHGIDRLASVRRPVTVGGVTLARPLIFAAGLVKGYGFEHESDACRAVEQDVNIIPGWRSLPALLGPVEFGSFTRWPRLGNPGVVVWRDVATRSTQNRVGLRNPGARAAAAFLARHAAELPAQYGINIAVSPGVDDPAEQQIEVLEALDLFLERDLRPAWLTLNLSCPNTEDDPGGHQTEARTRDLCRAVIERLGAIPLWVKLGPTLADEQYRVLLRVFHETGVRAIVATNTLPEPSPPAPDVLAGIGGGRLHTRALEVAALLLDDRARHGYTVDVIGGGGVLDGATLDDFRRLGIPALQYWSALIYRGPLAAAVIEHEAEGTFYDQHTK